MDPLSIVASVVGLLQAISTTYATFNTIRNLPKAFEHVRTYLPLAQRILKDVRAQLKQRNLTKAEQQSITRIIRECEIKATELKQIFDALEKKCKQDKDARSWDKLRGWYHEILRGIKGHRVESLMNDILEAMKKLALYQRFRLATQEDVAEIKKALEDISHVEPSLDDAAVESKTLIQATQIVNIGGMVQQNNPSGGMNTFNPVYNVSVDTVNLGKAP
ncbi:ankyrin repeat protein [Penicillium soppii]|uniref:ankyrin repeat protein n=1 Tax=Penicillium soppii TaxID=69789 RepID=UPI00254848E4|nr:ankyrin repeat protein [Penicillium soppii]KAJ5855611.1 ankyrin repeat protein [Penicillium soppii]